MPSRERRGRDLLHPVTSIGGVGASLGKGLAGFRVASAEELLAIAARDVKAFGDAVPGITPQQLRESLLPQARFLVLGDVGKELAVGLVAIGFRGYTDLVAAPTKTLHTQLVNEIGERHTPDETALAQLQLDAARALLTGLLVVTVVDAKRGKPVAGAELTFRSPGFMRGTGAVTRRGDDLGLVVSPRLRTGQVHEGVIEADGYQRQTVLVRVRPGEVQLLDVGLRRGSSRPTTDDFDGRPSSVLSGNVSFRIDDVGRIRDLPVRTPLRVVDTGEVKSLSLVSLWRRRYGNVLRVPALDVPRDSLPPRVRPGDVVEVQADRTLKRLTARQVERLLAARDGVGEKGN